MGPNGSGKSTLLKTLVGQMQPAFGSVLFQCSAGIHRADLEYIPQDYRQALFPWKTVRGNVRPWRDSEERFATGGDDQRPSVEQALEWVGLDPVKDRYVFELSGGQQQLVLIARCMVSSANVLLLDEPFSAVDIVRRSRISSHLRDVWRNQGNVVICAMHEPEEAVTLADEVLIFHGPPFRLDSTVRRPAAAEDPAGPSLFRDLLLSGIQHVSKGDIHG